MGPTKRGGLLALAKKLGEWFNIDLLSSKTASMYLEMPHYVIKIYGSYVATLLNMTPTLETYFDETYSQE